MIPKSRVVNVDPDILSGLEDAIADEGLTIEDVEYVLRWNDIDEQFRLDVSSETKTWTYDPKTRKIHAY